MFHLFVYFSPSRFLSFHSPLVLWCLQFAAANVRSLECAAEKWFQRTPCEMHLTLGNEMSAEHVSIHEPSSEAQATQQQQHARVPANLVDQSFPFIPISSRKYENSSVF